MRQTAEGIAALGRGNDSMLIHMSPREVGGLQQLAMAHGGSLTINPHTGLPEAGFLESILPMLAAGATTAMGFGPIGGVIAGGLTGAMTNQRNPLMGALMGGIGGYGISGLGNSLSGAGLNEIQQGAAQAMDVAGQQAFAPAFNAETARQAIPTDYAVFDPTEFGVRSEMSPQAVAQQAQFAAMEGATPNTNIPYKDTIQRGVSVAASDPLSFAKSNAAPLAAVGIPLLLSSGAMSPKTLATGTTATGGRGNIRPYEYTTGQVNPRFGQPGEPYYLGQGYTPQPVYAAATGGLTPPMQETYPTARIPGRMVGGGISGVQEYAAGGKLLEGPGDGMSDSIPAVIKGPQPQRAALAQGEFVIPADVVSHLGNGSTDAGAKRLYAMMDKVRHARTGNKKQGRQIQPEKFMPA